MSSQPAPAPQKGVAALREIIIGPARQPDAEAILKLQYLCFQQEAALYDDYSIPPLTQTLAGLLAEFDSHRILVARLGDEIIGSVRGIARDGSCLVRRLIVHPRLQKHGIGARLLQALEDAFPDVTRFELFTGDRSDGNLRLYQRFGYVGFQTKAETPAVNLIWMEKFRNQP